MHAHMSDFQKFSQNFDSLNCTEVQYIEVSDDITNY